jgi:ParB family chromosome partitioning protein
MKRKDLLKTAFTSDPPGATPVAPTSERVPSGAVRAMGLSLGRISEDAARVEALEEQVARGGMIYELDPLKVEPSFIDDRLARTADAEFRRLVESISSTGQQVPILVRAHPDRSGHYQVAYGHRRLSACIELKTTVKAIVRPLTDVELVVAQGKENAERRNLSFIERAMFASHLEQRGFERATIQSALAVHRTELTRFLIVVNSIPTDIITAIGPSPRAGRPRWMELAKLLEGQNGREIIATLINQPSFQRSSSDARFDIAINKLRVSPADAASERMIKNRYGHTVIRTERSATSLRLIVDLRVAPGLDEHLLELLPGIVAEYSRS